MKTLDEILKKYNCGEIFTAEAKQEILDWVDREIIGKNEFDHSGDEDWEVPRDELREEQRQKLQNLK